MKVIAQQGDSIDLICWRYFGRTGRITEQVMDLNPGLARRGAILPEGQEIILPDVPAVPQRKLIQIWD